MEARVREAIHYIKQNPEAKVTHVAQQFQIARTTLVDRLNGAQSRQARKPANPKLLSEEEVAVCRYIDRLDGMNLAIRPEFVTDTANYILKERSLSR